ncbi:MAG TPA: molybdenum cofactor synthesis domain-containing protein [Draconibacterium sp.]|jgi:molybdenum cofactor synthesis domain-containing protein|nr:molybdenum cofactor synthesis domain-containing protein [Draconibacterium sp.]
MKQIEIVSVNISDKKGIIKHPVESIVLNSTGIAGDAHAGDWHRQVSLLASESILQAEMKAGATFHPGTFAENITTKGIELHKTAPFDRFVNSDVELEVTQIGKKCHNTCAIGKQIGNCIMPLEGIFCRVLKAGELKPGTVLDYIPRIIKVQIITLSDRASKGIYEDRSGPMIRDLMTIHFTSANRHFSIENTILPDDGQLLREEIEEAVRKDTDIIVTTGGTGIGPRDISPDIIKTMLDKEITGIMELVRVKYGMQNPNAVISRSVAGTIGNTLVYCLPGSTKAISEYMSEILPTLEHSFRMIYSIDSH